ncbi:hypothetical protein [Saccharopolyspora pogona]|uniref:hypothetical protein n=1 Tax=Saccharopolyspora pogona TaxID=333966 RepID=UPI001683EFC8|nr:hypothetical protein [Saccharopolyspora pogona]
MAIEHALRPPAGENWTQVERLRLQTDLRSLAAAQRHWSGSPSRRAEPVRDAAERLADDLNQVTSDRPAETRFTVPKAPGARARPATGARRLRP